MPEVIPDQVTVEVVKQGGELSYRVLLTMPGGGTHPGELDLDALRARLGELEDVWLSGSPEAYGRVLFEGLYPGDLSHHYGTALGAAGDRGIRLLLKLDDRILSLHSIPWERLYQPQGDGWVPVAAAPNVLLSRYLPTGDVWGLPSASGSLRVLLVVSAPYPLGHPLYIDSDKEREAIARAFQQFPGQVQCDFLPGPVTLEAIATALDAGNGYDVLHYAGHGAWMADEGQACLILEEPSEDGVQPKVVFDQDIVGRLQSGRHLPRLIALFACETAGRPAEEDTATRSSATPSSTTEAFMGLGPRLVEAGCPAVICMQGRVEDAIARHFAERFYAALLEGGVVDLAMNRARTSVHERWAWQWALPVLFMRLNNGMLFQPKRRFLPQERRPYKGLLPFTREDADLFMGRSAEIAEICARIADFPLTVVHGEPGSGLTSLMAAGVRPQLEAEDDLVVPIGQYPDLALEARRGLAAVGWTSPLPVVGNAPLSMIAQATFSQRFRRLVLILDQAERIVDLLAEDQARVLADLADCLDICGDRLRIVFAVHEDTQPALSDLLRPLCRWPLATVPLLPLSVQGAEEAIIKPLEVLNWPVALVPKSLAKGLIVPELSELSNRDGRIDPTALQIVCERLYREALEAEHAVTNDLYNKNNGAEGRLAAYAKEMLSQLDTDRPAAEHILAGVAAVRGERWVSVERLVSDGQPTAHERALLDRLMESRLLLERYTDGQQAFALANPVVANMARHLRGTAGLLSAQDEIDRIWSEWLERDALANHGQLRYLRHLVRAGTDPRAKPPQALLLLRSAVARNEPLDPWLEWVRAGTTEALVKQLELPGRPGDEAMRAGRSTLQKGANVLGAMPPGLEQSEEPFGLEQREEPPYGAVAQAAVASGEPVVRRTAALAMTALDATEAVNRLHSAMEDAGPQGMREWLRLIELRGTLIDAQPATLAFHSRLSHPDRAGIWLWRVWQRMLRDRHRIAVLTVGGAVGAAVALALLRCVTTILISDQYRPGLATAMNFFWGLLLGASLIFGMLLARVLTPNGLDVGEKPPTGVRQSSWFAALSIGLGTLFFGTMLAFVSWLAGFAGITVVPVLTMGFVAGIGLSLAVYGQPAQGWRLGWFGWLTRLGVAALGFAFSYLPFLLPEYAGSSITIVVSGQTYCSNFPIVLSKLWPHCENQSALLATLGMLDAALVGASLALGISTGLLVADRWLRRWYALAAHAGD